VNADGAVLSARDLVLERGGRLVLTVPSLDVRAGETLVLLGPNGAGKTTLLQALALLVRPRAGTIAFHGRAVDLARDPVAIRRRMAVVFQQPLLLDRGVLENVELGLALRGVGRAERTARARLALRRLGIGHLEDRHARRLSGTSVVVTHDRDEALSLADRIAILLEGRVRQVGSPDAVFGTPADTGVASFVGVETVLPARVREVADDITRLDVAGHLVEVTALPPAGDRAPLLLVAPGDVVVSLAREAGSARNHFAARVVRLEPIGRAMRVMLDCGFPLVAHVTRASARELGLAAGAEVVASFKATAPHLLPRRRGTPALQTSEGQAGPGLPSPQ
jgi:tungstate transport system ATP-binding protein